MKVIPTAVLVGSLFLGRPAAGEIIYGPWTFTDNAFADLATKLGAGDLQVFPEKAALCALNSASVLEGF